MIFRQCDKVGVEVIWHYYHIYARNYLYIFLFSNLNEK